MFATIKKSHQLFELINSRLYQHSKIIFLYIHLLLGLGFFKLLEWGLQWQIDTGLMTSMLVLNCVVQWLRQASKEADAKFRSGSTRT